MWMSWETGFSDPGDCEGAAAEGRPLSLKVFSSLFFAGGQRGVAGRCAGSRRLGKGYDLGGLTACMKGVCDRRELKLPASG